jgi:DNA-binding response OmpR family regulator
VPVLFCSAASPDDPLIRGINARGLQLLPKPFNRSRLSHAIESVLKQPALPAL